MAAPPPCLIAPAHLASSTREPPQGRALPRVLAIGGSDSSCGAGIQADLQSIAANGGHPVTAVTAVTAQHSGGVSACFPLAPEAIRVQLAAAYADTMPGAVKTGMLASQATVEFLARDFRYDPPSIFVLDPVIRASSGARLLDEGGVEVLRTRLLPFATLVTPNVPEAEVLSGIDVRTLADVESAGRSMLAMGARAVLVKGGHLDASPATDVLVTADGVRAFDGNYIAGRDVHGTGCAYASAIATHLAHGCVLEDAIHAAKRYIEALIATALRVGPGALMADHLAAARMAWEDVR